MAKANAAIVLSGLVFSSVPAIALEQEKTVAQAAAEAVQVVAEVAEPHANRGAPPEQVNAPEPKNWDALLVKPADYPPSAWAADETGQTYFALSVDVEGKPTACTITESSGSQVLDEKSCEILLERGEFSPATDAQGNPISGIFEANHNWYKREPEFPGSATIHVEFTVTETGEVSNCRTVEMSGLFPESAKRSFEREPCPGSRRGARTLYRDENGNPIAKDVSLKVEVIVTDPE